LEQVLIFHEILRVCTKSGVWIIIYGIEVYLGQDHEKYPFGEMVIIIFMYPVPQGEIKCSLT
jgi:hypothetical protein